MKYDVEVCELVDIDGEIIGVDVMLLQRDNEGNLLDVVTEYTEWIDDERGQDDNSYVEDRNWKVEEEFNTLEEASKAYDFYLENITNFFD